MRVALVILATVALAATAGSLPFARAGLLDAPTATLLRHTEVAAGLGFSAYSYENADSTSESDFSLGGHVEFGLLDRVQLGVTYLGAGGISGQFRVLALRESITRPGIALGIENLTGEKNYDFFEGDSGLAPYPHDQNLSGYVVITKNLDYLARVPLMLNLGWGTGRFVQELDDDGIASPIPGLFFAVETHPHPSVSVALEWDGRDLNLGGHYAINRSVHVRGAVGELEQVFRSSERDMTDPMQSPKFTIGVEAFFGPFFNRTTLEPVERLRGARDEEALRQLEEQRREALREIEELLRAMEED